jgi:hypothetical protein
MKKTFLFVVISFIMTIAYIDLVDSFKRFDKIMSQVIGLDDNRKTKINVSKKVYSKTQR